MARKNQILVLRALGVDEDSPRADTVHAWFLDESSARAKQGGIHALSIIVSAYDEAVVTHFGSDADSAFSFKQNSHFGLRFGTFRVVLTVKPAFFRDVKFVPEDVPGLAWSEENAVCMLPAFRFEQLVNSDVTPSEFDDLATGQVELSKWENLHLLAREHHIRAEDIALWMFREVTERETRAHMALEQSKQHALLSDTNTFDTDAAPVPATPVPKAEVSAVVAEDLEVATAKAPAPVKAAVPVEPMPTVRQAHIPAPAAMPAVAPAILKPADAVAAAKVRATASAPHKAVPTDIRSHRMFITKAG